MARDVPGQRGPILRKPTRPRVLGPEGAPRLVLGQNPVREAIRANGPRVARVLIEQDPNPRLEALGRFARDAGVTVETVARADLDRLAGSGRHQGVAAWAPALQLIEASSLLEREQLLGLVLDGVVDPQNFGAAIRSAVGVAGAPIFWGESAAAPLTPATFRASAGAVEHAELCQVPSLSGLLKDAVLRGVQVVGLAPEAEQSLGSLDLRGPTLIVVGSEEAGMQRQVRRTCTHLGRLTTSRIVQSLNASVAAGIALHCAKSQRETNG